LAPPQKTDWVRGSGFGVRGSRSMVLRFWGLVLWLRRNHYSEPRTPEPEPRTPEREPRTPNPEPRSLFSQRDHRIHARGAACGKGAGGERHQREDNRYRSEGERIAFRNAEQEAGQRAAQGERSGETGSDADQSDAHPLADDQPHDTARLGAERDAHTDL